jgi:hypothetical protein
MTHDGAKPGAALCASANLQSLFTNFSGATAFFDAAV